MSSFVGGGGGGSSAPGSILATSNLNLYVATTGSDSNPGTIAQPFATIQHAFNVSQTYNYQNLYFPTIHVADGTYLISVNLIPPPLVNCAVNPAVAFPGGLLVGDNANSTLCVIDAQSTGSVFQFASAGASWNFSGFQLQGAATFNSYFNLFAAGSGAQVDNMTFSTSSAQSFGVAVLQGGLFVFGFVNFAVTWIGSRSVLVRSIAGSQVFDGGITTTFSGAQNYDNFVNDSEQGSLLDYPLATVVGAGNVTGARYRVDFNSSLSEAFAGDRSGYLGNSPGALDPGAFLVEDPLISKFAPTNGQTRTLIPGSHEVLMVPASGLATLTLVMPTNMSTGEKTNIVTTQPITAVTWTTTDGSSIVGAPAGLAANASITFLFSRTDNAWYCLGG